MLFPGESWNSCGRLPPILFRAISIVPVLLGLYQILTGWLITGISYVTEMLFARELKVQSPCYTCRLSWTATDFSCLYIHDVQMNKKLFRIQILSTFICSFVLCLFLLPVVHIIHKLLLFDPFYLLFPSHSSAP